MKRLTVIDGFNFFYRWGGTRAFFSAEGEMGLKIERALRRLAETPPAKETRPLVVLDGGLQAGPASVAGLRVEYAGPGQSADACILEMIRGAPDANAICVVTSDRTLGGHARSLGARRQSVEDFLGRWIDTGSTAPEEEPPPEKYRVPGPEEVAEWVDLFESAGDLEDEDL